MKKFLLAVVFFLSIAISAFSQKSFVGMTKGQVRNFWKTEVSSNYFDEGIYDDGGIDMGDPYFIVCSECGGGSYFTSNPEFSASFDKKTGKCIKNAFAIPSEQITVFAARFKKMGFTPDTRKGIDGWTDKKRGEFWTIEGNYRSGHSLVVYKW